MRDYLLCFADETTARAALPDLDALLPVDLVTAEAVYGEPGEDDEPPAMISPRELAPGYWLLAVEEGLSGQVATIERETGRIVAGDISLAGAHLDPAWAGAEPVLSVAEIEPEPEPDPPAISDRQFAQELAVLGVISEAQAIAWAARGELPAAMETAVAQLPEPDRFAARMLLSAATIYEFGHPLALQLGALLGFSEAERRQIWLAAGLL